MICRNIINLFFTYIHQTLKEIIVNKGNLTLHCVTEIYPRTNFSDIQLESHVSGSVSPLLTQTIQFFTSSLSTIQKNSYWSSFFRFQPHLLISYVFYTYLLPTFSAPLCRILCTFLHSSPVVLPIFLLGETR